MLDRREFIGSIASLALQSYERRVVSVFKAAKDFKTPTTLLYWWIDLYHIWKRHDLPIDRVSIETAIVSGNTLFCKISMPWTAYQNVKCWHNLTPDPGIYYKFRTLTPEVRQAIELRGQLGYLVKTYKVEDMKIRISLVKNA